MKEGRKEGRKKSREGRKGSREGSGEKVHTLSLSLFLLSPFPPLSLTLFSP
jgi:hypothetical protein